MRPSLKYVSMCFLYYFINVLLNCDYQFLSSSMIFSSETVRELFEWRRNIKKLGGGGSFNLLYISMKRNDYM